MKSLVTIIVIKTNEGLPIIVLPYKPTTNNPYFTQTHKDPKSDTANGRLPRLCSYPYSVPPCSLAALPLALHNPDLCEIQGPRELTSEGIHSSHPELTTCGRQTKGCHPVRMTVNLPALQGTGRRRRPSRCHGTLRAGICSK